MMAPDNHTAEQIEPLLPSDAGRADYGIATDRQIDQETQEEPEHQAERWNEPRINAWRVLATYYSFIVVGANDGSYGVCINPSWSVSLANSSQALIPYVC